MRIRQQQPRRIATTTTPMQQKQITEHAVGHQRHAENQFCGAVQGNGFRADGIHAVGNDGGGGGDHHELIQHGGRVIFQHAPMRSSIAAGLGQAHEFRLTFGKTKKQRQHQAAQQ